MRSTLFKTNALDFPDRMISYHLESNSKMDQFLDMYARNSADIIAETVPFKEFSTFALQPFLSCRRNWDSVPRMDT